MSALTRTKRETAELLAAFIEDYHNDEDTQIYVERIKKLPLTEKSYVNVDYHHLYLYEPEIAVDLLDKDEYPHRMDTFSTIFTEKLGYYHPEYAQEIGRVEARIVNLVDSTPVHKLKSSDMKRLVQVEGTVVQRGKPLVKPRILAYKCRVCGTLNRVEQTEQYRQKPLDPCPSCEKRKWIHSYEDSTFTDIQEIYIQELTENSRNGSSPDKVKIVLKGDLIRSCEPGENVVVVGILRAYDPSPRSRTLELNYHIDACSLVNNTDADTVKLSDEDVDEIREWMNSPDHLERVKNSIAPSIYGLDHIKEALAYQLCEGQVKYINETRQRGQFHILLAGPPGCGKSVLGDFMIDCHPKGRKAVGKGSTAVGLTASVSKEDNQWVLKAGAMALADRGFLFVDEIEKMDSNDSSAMHSGMSQQTVNINKADISAELKSRCSVLAACNPIGGVWDWNQTIKNNLHSKGKGLELTLLDRFALIFIIRQNRDNEVEEKVIEHIMRMNADPGGLKPPYTVWQLRKIFAYARSLDVVITEGVTERLMEFYMVLYRASLQNDALIITRRQPEDLVRLAEASARLHGRSETVLEDAEHAISIVALSLQDYGIDPDTGHIDQAKAMYDMRKSKREMIGEIPDVIERLCEKNIDGEKVSRVEFVKYASNLWGVDRGEVGDLLEAAIREGKVFCPNLDTIAVT